MCPLRLAFVGLGAMGLDMLTAAVDHPELHVVGGADVDATALANAAGIAPDATFGDSAHSVFNHPGVDAVYIGTPPALHAEFSLAALAAGKGVFCEKPLAIDRADGQRMVEAAQASGLANAVNFSLSDRSAVLAVAEALARDEVGPILGVEVRVNIPVWPREFQAEARWVAERSQGGFIREVLSHFVYLTDRMVGPLRSAAGSSTTTYGTLPMASETSVHGLLRAGEVPVQVTGWAGSAAPETYEWTLLGERKSFRLTGWGDLSVSEGATWTPVPLIGERGSENTRLSLFAAAMRGHRSANLADFATAFRVQQVIESFHRQPGELPAGGLA